MAARNPHLQTGENHKSMMTLNDWNARTRRMFNTPRSAELQAIDVALTNYHTGGSATQIQKLALQSAVDAWLSANNPPPANVGYLKPPIEELKRAVTTVLGALATVTYAPTFAPAAYAQAAAGIALTNITPGSVDVSVPIHQNTMGTDFYWTTYFSLGLAGGILTVTVPIAPAALSEAEHVNVTKTMQDLWQTHIASFWNGAVIKRTVQEKYPVYFQIAWKAAGTPNCFELNAVTTPPIVTAGLSWQQKAAQWDEIRDGSSMGTPHMGQFGSTEKQAISHEFGHMLGNPDEYDTTEYMNTGVPTDPFDQPAFTTRSVMNNTTKEGRLFPRHYQLVKRAFENWKGWAANSTEVIV